MAKRHVNPRGRITFDVAKAERLVHGELSYIDRCTIPVLFDGQDVGIAVHLTANNFKRDLFNDARAVIVGALGRKLKSKV